MIEPHIMWHRLLACAVGFNSFHVSTAVQVASEHTGIPSHIFKPGPGEPNFFLPPPANPPAKPPDFTKPPPGAAPNPGGPNFFLPPPANPPDNTPPGTPSPGEPNFFLPPPGGMPDFTQPPPGGMPDFTQPPPGGMPDFTQPPPGGMPDFTQPPPDLTQPPTESPPPLRRSPLNPIPIIDAMRMFPQIPQMMNDACYQLNSIARPVPGETKNKEQNKIVAAKGDRLIIEAMKTFPEDFALQYNCSICLGALGKFNPEMQTMLGNNGAVEALAEAIRTFQDRTEITVAIDSLIDLTEHLEGHNVGENIRREGRVNVTAPVMKLLRHFTDNADVVLPCLKFTLTTCAEHKMKNEIIESGFLEFLPKIMRAHILAGFKIPGEVVRVVDSCFATHAEDRDALAKHGFIEELDGLFIAANNDKSNDTVVKDVFDDAMDVVVKYAQESQYQETIRNGGMFDNLQNAMRQRKLVNTADFNDKAFINICFLLTLFETNGIPIPECTTPY